MKKTIKNILILLILFFIIILVLIIFNLKKQNNIEKNINNNEYYFNENEKNILNNYFYDITYNNEFFEIEELVDSYYEECKLNNSDIVLEFLDKNYINQKNININNIFEKINYEEDYNNFFAKKMYYEYIESNDEEANITYYIKGDLWSDNYNSKKEIFLIIYHNLYENKLYIFPQENINLNENDFEKIIYEKQKDFLNNYRKEEIELLDYEQNYEKTEEEISMQKDVTIGEEIEEEEDVENDEVEKSADILEADEDNEDEEYDIWEDNYYQITEEDIARRLYNEFTIIMIYDTEESYKLLTEKFKNNNLKDLNKYKKYIEKNKEKILNGKIEKYKQKYNIIDEEIYDTIYSAINSNNIYFNFYIDYNKNIKFDFGEL